MGMSRDEMVDALGTIARSGTKEFMDRIEAAQSEGGAQLIGQFGVGFYSAFMVADRVDVISRQAGTNEAALWSSDGKGSYTISESLLSEAPVRGTRVVLHLMESAASYTERHTLERIVRAQSGHVPVPIVLVEAPGSGAREIADGAALWTKPRAEITADEFREEGVHAGVEELANYFREDAHEEYKLKEDDVTAEVMRDVERYVVLQVVDTRWREHLENMDYLREGVHLRAFAQKDPLVEYRSEGHGMFEELGLLIREEVLMLLFHAQIGRAHV